jgi:MFS superfamily sulfate permease-like transporter
MIQPIIPSSFVRSSMLPASIIALHAYSARTFLSDLIAGVTVGLVALPLAMAFAISSGMPPEAGIYTAVVTGFLISALGGSFVQIGGPTGTSSSSWRASSRSTASTACSCAR